jgi:hypothetical protein
MKHDEDTKQGYPFNAGFKSFREMELMARNVPLDRTKELDTWKKTNGTRDGLLILLGVYPNENPANFVYENMEARDRWFDIQKQLRMDQYHLEKQEMNQRLLEDLRDLEIMKVNAMLATPHK